MERLAKIKTVNAISVSSQIIGQTLAELQRVGQRHSECVLLWLGSRDANCVCVEKIWVPEQEADYDYFRIPENSMESLFNELRSHRLMIAAQVHSHPRRAFHSYADDEWAIVRHAGALSLVLPYFAQRTRLETFVTDAVVFVLSANNEWLKVPKRRVLDFYRIVA